MFEHCTDQPYYPDSGTGSGRSSPAHSSPRTPVHSFPSSPLDVAVASEDSWNLIPYDVPWGPEYYHYSSGTLPGPDGACIFLRSPTPLKNRRTQKACNKCRQRKAKCSGTRPACTRCLARGYICEYVEEEKDLKRSASQSASRRRRQRERSACSSEPTETVDMGSDCESYTHSTKVEEQDMSFPDLSYPDEDAGSAHSIISPTDYGSQCDDCQSSMMMSYEYESHMDSYGDAAMNYKPPAYTVSQDTQAYYAQDLSPMFQDLHEQRPAATSVHAPRPVRCTGSPPFLSPHERMDAFSIPSAAQDMQHNSMLINLSAEAAEPAPQITIPQVPPMAPTNPALEAVSAGYAPPQEMYYYPPAEPMTQFPYLSYQYTVPTYTPIGSQEGIAPAMLYTMSMAMPSIPVGMTA